MYEWTVAASLNLLISTGCVHVIGRNWSHLVSSPVFSWLTRCLININQESFRLCDKEIVTKCVICKTLKLSTLHIFSLLFPSIYVLEFVSFSPGEFWFFKNNFQVQNYISRNFLVWKKPFIKQNNFHLIQQFFFMESILLTVFLEVYTLCWLWYVVTAVIGYSFS